LLTKTVLFIHGAWMTPACFDDFCERFEEAGYTCVAPAWPLMDRPVESLRTYPSPDLADVGIEAIVDHYAAIIGELEEPPLLVGHSFGGLFVQMLLDRGLGVGGVAIDSAPPRGVSTTLTSARANWPAFSARNGDERILTITYDDFAWGFAQTLPEAELRAVFDEHVVPSPGRLFREAGRGPATVDFGDDERAPLLLIAGGEDRTVTAKMNLKNYKRYRGSEAVTDYQSFEGRSHWIIAEPGWEEVADYAIDWAGAL